LKTLRSKLETRHDLKTRTEEYRNWQRGFLPKKHAVMVGKTLEEFEASLPPKTANLADPDAEIDDEAMRKGIVAWLPAQRRLCVSIVLFVPTSTWACMGTCFSVSVVCV
jgi:hypothetical protein